MPGCRACTGLASADSGSGSGSASWRTTLVREPEGPHELTVAKCKTAGSQRDRPSSHRPISFSAAAGTAATASSAEDSPRSEMRTSATGRRSRVLPRAGRVGGCSVRRCLRVRQARRGQGLLPGGHGRSGRHTRSPCARRGSLRGAAGRSSVGVSTDCVTWPMFRNRPGCRPWSGAVSVRAGGVRCGGPGGVSRASVCVACVAAGRRDPVGALFWRSGSSGPIWMWVAGWWCVVGGGVVFPLRRTA